MMRLIFPLILGLGGAAILLGLGTWQLQRLEWKMGVLAGIEAQMQDAPVSLPEAPDAERDQYLPVTVEGTLMPEAIYVLVSRKQLGAGYRLIQPVETGGRRVLLDRGFLRDSDRPAHQPASGVVSVTANLLWPAEVDSYTPAPDMARKIWFARDVSAMAQALGAEPLLLIERAATPPDPMIYPMPLDTTHIPNDHLQYAVTWFLLAVVWLGMTALLVWRIWRPDPPRA